MTEEKKAKPVNRALIVARAKKAIHKATGQKPLEANMTTMPHVPTGSFSIDMLIGGTPTKDGKGLVCPGFPRRRITELYGPESSGKTTLLISAMVQAQKAGGTAMFIDFEHALDHNYAKALGLSYDDDKLLVYQPETMEDGFKTMFLGILSGFDIIGVDSVAAMVPKAELEKGFDDPAKIGAVAAKFSIVLPKFALCLQKYPRDESDKAKSDPNHPGTALIFVNQIRAFIPTSSYGHSDTENTSGGKALKFFAYLRLRAAKIKSEVIERTDPMTGKKRRFPYGNLTEIKVVKSKVDGKQGHSTTAFIRYGIGIDDYYSIIETGCVHKIIKREGAYYTLGDQRFQGKDKFRLWLIQNPKVFDALKVKLAQAVNSTAMDVVEELSEEDSLIEGFDVGDDDDLASAAEAAADEVIATEETAEA